MKNFIIRYLVRKKRPKKVGVFYYKHKEEARVLVLERILFWNKIYNFKYGRVSIKNQKTRWGSCSLKGNLNFSYKLIFLPSHLVDYVIVHELCHLKEFNHGANFWKLVSDALPDCQKNKRELKVSGAKYASIKKVGGK